MGTRTRAHTQSFLQVLGGSVIPFLSPSVPRVSESFGKRVVVNLQLCYLSTMQSQNKCWRNGTRIKTLSEPIVFTWPTFGTTGFCVLTHTETSVLDRSHGRPRICIINKSVMMGRYSHRPLERNSATKYSSMGPHKPPSPQKKGPRKQYLNR